MGKVSAEMFNMVYSDEDRIQDQKHAKRIFWDRYYEDFKFLEWLKNMQI